MKRVGWLFALLGALAGGTADGAAQSQASCWLHWNGGYTSSNQAAPGQRVIYASGGIDYRCADGARVLSDSAIVFEAQDRVSLFGGVSYLDVETELDADRAFYLSREGQLNAWENVEVRDLVNGAVITGEELVLYRASDVRAVDRMTVRGGNPHARIRLIQGGLSETEDLPDEGDEGEGEGVGIPADTLSEDEEAPEPPRADTVIYDVDAERFILEGRRFFRAAGRVVVHRDSLEAFGDSLDFDQADRVMHLLENARVLDPKFELSARTVSMLTGSHGDEILARENADLTADAVDLDAPAIRMFTQGGALSRLVAMSRIPDLPAQDIEDAFLGLSEGDLQRLSALQRDNDPPASPTSGVPEDPELIRPTAVADDFRLEADSIDVLSPGQVLDQVIAVGGARAETAPDSLGDIGGLDDLVGRDWIEGDTIIADFHPPASADVQEGGGGRGRLRQLTARGHGRSVYQMAPSDTTGTSPSGSKALHYVTADVIRIFFEDGEVSHMEVEGQVEGYHLEPRPRTNPDSVPVDTVGVASDIPEFAASGGDPIQSAETWFGDRGPTRTATRSNPLPLIRRRPLIDLRRQALS